MFISLNGKLYILETGEPTDRVQEWDILKNGANYTPTPSKHQRLALMKEEAFSGHCRVEVREEEPAFFHHLQ